MRIGVPTEIKPSERRVGLTPDSVHALADRGHEVLIQRGAGEGSGFTDEQYERAGARLTTQEEAWGEAELLVKVKEPVASEFGFLRGDLTLFTYLHLAADRPLTEALLSAGTTAIAYETVREGRALPLLAPMSEIAGRLAAQAAAQHTLSTEGGPGILLGGTPGVRPARVLVLGGGVVGTQAAQLAVGLRAEVTILDAYLPRVRQLTELFGATARVLASNPATIERELREADVVIGSVLVPGAAGLVTADFASLPPVVWLAVLYLAVVTTAITFLLLQYASMRLPASKVLGYGYLTPSFIILLEGLLVNAGR